MALAAPSRIQVNVAPQVFADPDITFNDMDEQLMVSNLSKREVIWRYARQEWVLKPGGKPQPIKLAVCIKYLGDPRSAVGVTNTFQIPGENRPGVVPERYKELQRLSVMYGVYEGSVNKIATIKFREMPRDRQDPGRDLWPEYDPGETVVPKIKVLTWNGAEVQFPIFAPDANPYRYNTEASGMSDVRTELEKSRAQYQILADKIDALSAAQASGDAEIPGAMEDSVGPPNLG